MKTNRLLGLVTALLCAFTLLFGAAAPARAASSRVYYTIDFSSAVAKTTVLMHGGSDCSIASMATIEAYMHGATTSSDRSKVYHAVVDANGDDTYAYWSNVGYQTFYTIDWEDIYDRLEQGVPSIIHRTSGNGHWSVVAGYKGSASTLEPDKFVVVNVYTGKGGNCYPNKNYDVKTVGSWRNGSEVDRMILRKDGIAVTDLSPGIRMAVNQPPYVHHRGTAHAMYGYLASSEKITDLQVRITNARTGEQVFQRNDTVNKNYYQFSKLDSKLKFSSLSSGEYFFTVYAADGAGNTKLLKKYFVVDSGWPPQLPQEPLYALVYDPNGAAGTAESLTVRFMEDLFTLPECPFSRPGYAFLGWSVRRASDGCWYASSIDGWASEQEIASRDYALQLFPPGYTAAIDWPWMRGSTNWGDGFTFYAQWQPLCTNGHTWNAGEVIQAPTTSSTGIRRFTCIHCGEIQDRTIPVEPHTHIYSGSDDRCSLCGAKRSSEETVPMYRLYNPNTGEHFYTGSLAEWEDLVSAGWQYEGIAWNAPAKSGTPVYRLFNPNTGDHHYTMSTREREDLVNVGWQYEGVAWNSAGIDRVRMYRLYNPNALCGSHHYTGSQEERDHLVSLGWIYEGIGWYGIP